MGRYEQQPRPKKPRKKALTPAKRKRRRRILSVVGIVTLSLCIWLAIYLTTPPAQVDPPPVGDPTAANPVMNGDTNPGADKEPTSQERGRKKSFYTVLLVGTLDDYNTDTIMLASVDADADIVNVISIPRDTMVDIEAKNKKINGAYGRDGIEELCREVQAITAIYPDFYCVVNMASFVKIVDLFGGVEFNVPYNMYHPDADSRYTINLQKGMQTLNGKKALQMVRFRGTSQNDFGRMELQRNFLVAIAKKVLNSFTLAQVTDLIPIVNESVKTNMPVKDMLWFYTNVVSEIDFDANVHFHAMPAEATGTYKGLSYVYLDKQAVADLLNETVNPYDQDIQASELNIIRLES